MKIGVNQLAKLPTKDSYYLIRSKGQIEDLMPFYIVVSLERNGEMMKKDDGTPVFYVAYDQGKLNEIGVEQEFYQAFSLPEMALATDKLSIYCWNPSKGKVRISDFEFYVRTEKE